MPPEVDETLLTAEELATYSELMSAAAGNQASIEKLGRRWRLRTCRASFTVLALWCVATASLFVTMVVRDTGKVTSTDNEPLLWPLIALVAASPLIFVLIYHETKVGLRKLVPTYLDSIGYADRAPAPKVRSDSSDDGPAYVITHQYDPSRYYSYSPRERDRMRSTGMDADHYDSNVRDHDKD